MVEWKSIEKIGSYFGGLTGKTKEDFETGNGKYITYMNVFSNPALNPSVVGVVKINEGEKQNKIQRGDVLFTGSSETPEETGMSCVVTDKLDGDFYMNSFCFGLRLFKPEQYNLHYLKHLLRSESVRKSIAKTASGVTRFNISKARFSKILIPIPSLEEQTRIVGILDTFTSSIDNLKQQIEQRRKQYEYYREKLMYVYEGPEARLITLGEIGTFERGNGIQKKDFTEEGVGCIHYGQIHTYYGLSTTETISYISKEQAKKCKKAQCGDIIIATTSEDVEGCAKAVAWLGDHEICISGDSLVFHHNENPKYIAYLFQMNYFQKFKRGRCTGAKVTRISPKALSDYPFVLPTRSRQAEIVSKLDNFEKSIRNLEEQLKLREKQYEYYRNKLLTFE